MSDPKDVCSAFGTPASNSKKASTSSGLGAGRSAQRCGNASCMETKDYFDGNLRQLATNADVRNASCQVVVHSYYNWTEIQISECYIVGTDRA